MTTRLEFVVTGADTAEAVGSGSLPVLGTPRLLAWCEAATCAALEEELPEGATSVGTRVQLEHLAASPVGQRLEVTASEVYADGRLRRFTVAARHLGDPDPTPDPATPNPATPDPATPGKVVATGEITRVVVDADRFLSRLTPPPTP